MSLAGSSCTALVALCSLLVACSSDPMSPAAADYASSAAGMNAELPQAGNSAAAGTGSLTGSAGDAASAGTGGVGGSGVAPDADGGVDSGLGGDVDAEVGPAKPKPPCLKKASQVAMLGDSYINWVSHTFPSDLDKEAGQTFRMYAVGATSMATGGVGTIPPQLDKAIAEDPDLTTIVMDGGGNDVLVPDTQMFPHGGDCKMSAMSPMIADCRTIVDKAIAAASKMMDNGIAHGIAHVVYFFYPNVPEGTLIGGTHPNEILEYAYPLVKDFCDKSYERTGGKATCYFVDLRPVFKGHPEYFAPTDIHPNGMGSAAMAKAVWQTMKDNCLAQPESSGCCEP